jgi:CheW-like domain
LIDEIRLLAENQLEGVVMGVSATKKEEYAIPTSTPSPGFLITTISGRYLAFEAGLIQGVLTGEEVGPSLQDPVVQGITYRPVDLYARLHLPSESLWDKISVVLLAEGKYHGSVRVQKVHGILEIHRSQVLPLPAQFRGPERGWYQGMILFDHSVALVLNTAWVCEEQVAGVESRTESQGMSSIVALQGAIQNKN